MLGANYLSVVIVTLLCLNEATGTLNKNKSKSDMLYVSGASKLFCDKILPAHSTSTKDCLKHVTDRLKDAGVAAYSSRDIHTLVEKCLAIKVDYGICATLYQTLVPYGWDMLKTAQLLQQFQSSKAERNPISLVTVIVGAKHFMTYSTWTRLSRYRSLDMPSVMFDLNHKSPEEIQSALTKFERLIYRSPQKVNKCNAAEVFFISEYFGDTGLTSYEIGNVLRQICLKGSNKSCYWTFDILDVLRENLNCVTSYNMEFKINFFKHGCGIRFNADHDEWSQEWSMCSIIYLHSHYSPDFEDIPILNELIDKKVHEYTSFIFVTTIRELSTAGCNQMIAREIKNSIVSSASNFGMTTATLVKKTGHVTCKTYTHAMTSVNRVFNSVDKYRQTVAAEQVLEIPVLNIFDFTRVDLSDFDPEEEGETFIIEFDDIERYITNLHIQWSRGIECVVRDIDETIKTTTGLLTRQFDILEYRFSDEWHEEQIAAFPYTPVHRRTMYKTVFLQVHNTIETLLTELDDLSEKRRAVTEEITKPYLQRIVYLKEQQRKNKNKDKKMGVKMSKVPGPEYDTIEPEVEFYDPRNVIHYDSLMTRKSSQAQPQ